MIEKIMESLNNKALYFIAGHGRGWAFSSNDLMEKFSRQQADNLLSDLAKEGKIRRVGRGVYDYPKYSELLQKKLSPDIDQVARAIARKFKWRIAISGESALNLLGLSTQVEGKYVYLSDGPNRSYMIMNSTLTFKKSVLKDMGFKYKESTLIVQALKSLGKNHIDNRVIKKIRSQIDPKMHDKILKDTKTVTGWIYEAIRKICKMDLNDG